MSNFLLKIVEGACSFIIIESHFVKHQCLQPKELVFLLLQCHFGIRRSLSSHRLTILVDHRQDQIWYERPKVASASNPMAHQAYMHLSRRLDCHRLALPCESHPFCKSLSLLQLHLFPLQITCQMDEEFCLSSRTSNPRCIIISSYNSCWDESYHGYSR